jgi:NADPH-dependent 2,4-dienoyl-CoA reductase/sulfur reductase-like enzyme
VETVHLVSGQPVHVALGTHANKQGRVAGINLGGGYATFPGVVGYGP